MKKIIVASLVGAVLLFIWNSLSWMVLPVHKNSMKYTAGQDEILNVISSNISEDGAYFLPNVNPELPKEEQDKIMEDYEKNHIGKPWAMVTYHKSWQGMHMANFVFMILFQLLSVLLVSWMLYSASTVLTSGFTKWMFVMCVPILISLNSDLSAWVWFEQPWHSISGNLIDHFAGWGIVGIWLAWFFRD